MIPVNLKLLTQNVQLDPFGQVLVGSILRATLVESSMANFRRGKAQLGAQNLQNLARNLLDLAPLDSGRGAPLCQAGYLNWAANWCSAIHWLGDPFQLDWWTLAGL